jgi:hypothetical protein
MKNPSDNLPSENQTMGTPWQASAVGPLRPKRRFRVLERTMQQAQRLPAPATSERTLPGKLKRSGQPQQIWKQPPGPVRTVPSKSLSTQQLIEWLARSPFAATHLRHSH